MEVSPNADPPVCRVLNYGKLKYEEKKKIQINKKKQHVIKVKEIRVRPRIDTHDLMTKLNMGRKFLSDGCKLKITLIFRGRELSRIDLGKDVMDRVIEELSEIDTLGRPAKSNLVRFLSILFIIFTNPYGILVKRRKNHSYEFTGFIIHSLRQKISPFF